MDHTKNERGYALLVVLLLIVFITILAAVFLRGSISNAKQEKLIDNSHLTVVTAETGVDFYKTLYSNKYFNTTALVESETKIYLEAKKNNDKKTLNTADYTDGRRYAAGRLAFYLNQTAVPGLPVQLSTSKNLFSFESSKVKPITIIAQQDSFSVKVSGNIIGKDITANKTKSLTFEQIFMVPSFDPADKGGGTAVSGDWTYPNNPSKKTCPESSKIENNDCFVENKNKKVKEIEDSTVYFPNGYTYTKDQDFEIDDSKVYVKGNLRLEKGELEVEDSFLAVEGSVYVGDELEVEESRVFIKGDLEAINEIEVENSTVKIGGTLTARDDLEVEDSNVEIGGSLYVTNEFELEDSNMIVKGSAALRGEVEIEDSMLYVGGALHMSGSEIQVKDKSKVCVAGSLQIDKKVSISSSSFIYHVGAFAYFGGGTPSMQIKQLTLDEFNKKCPIIAEPTPETGIKWPSPSIDVSYQ